MRNALKLLGAEEPSTLLLASLDWALYTAGRQDWSAHFRQCELMKESIGNLRNLSVLSQKDLRGAYARDASKVVVDVSKKNSSGAEAAEYLKMAGIFVQDSDRKRILLSTGPEDDSNWYFRLLKALDTIPERKGKRLNGGTLPVWSGKMTLSVREAANAKRQYVPLGEAAGRISAETVEILPYGMLCILPGEVILEETIESIEKLKADAVSVRGITEGYIGVI